MKDNLGAIIAAAVALVGSVGGVIGLLFRSIILYLFNRIKTLEEREASTLRPLVEATNNQQKEIETISGFVVSLVKDRERRQWIEEQGRKAAT